MVDRPARSTSTSSRRPAAPQAHGGLADVELAGLGVVAADILDVSANLNPYGPDPVVEAAVRAADLVHYPDATGHAARVALAASLGTSADRVILGNGAAELLWGLVRAVVAPQQRLLIVEPTFSIPAAAAAAAGVDVVHWRAHPGDDFAVNLDAVAARARTTEARAVYLCNPNNPTGVAVPAAAIVELAAALPTTTVILDEAFLSLADRAADATVALPGNVVRVRSLTKDHALAGVRVGYALAPPALIAALEAARPPWTVSAPALAAVVASTTAEAAAFVAASRQRLQGDRAALVAGLAAIGLRAVPSTTCFVLVPVADATRRRAALLADHRVAVRDATSFGLPDHIRLAVRPAADAARVVAALAASLATPAGELA